MQSVHPIGEQLVDAADRCGDNGQTMRHRFHHDEAKGLHLGSMHQNTMCPKETEDIARHAREINLVRDIEMNRQPVQISPVEPIPDYGESVTMAPPFSLAEDVEDIGLILPWLERPDGNQVCALLAA